MKVVDVPNPHAVAAGIGILKAVKEDLTDDFLSDVRTLISADVFTDFLEMADHLHQNSYIHPAASLAGAVLEDGMRQIAVANGVNVRAREDLGSLNQKLAAASVYNRLKQQQVQPWIRVRNHADQGEFNEYTATDVAEMIRGVSGFLADYLR